MPPTWVTVVVVVVAILGASTMGVLRMANNGFVWQEESLKSLNQVGNCRVLNPPDLKLGFVAAPAEDVEVDLTEDVLYIGASDVQQTVVGYPTPKFRGGHPRFSFGSNVWDSPQPSPGPNKVKPYLPSEWNPVGVSLLRVVGNDHQESLFIFSTNFNRTIHQIDHSIGIFKVVPKEKGGVNYEQQHIFKHKAIQTPNDIAALSATEFYLSNDHAGLFVYNPLGYLFDMLGFGTGQVVYCDVAQNQCKVVAEGLAFANGVLLSSDNSRLYVGESFGRRVLVYKRDTQTNELTLEESVPIDGFVDNLNLDADGRVWVAATMDCVATVSAMGDISGSPAPAPSAVYRMTPKSGTRKFSRPVRTVSETDGYWVEIMMADNGQTISPLTSAAPTRHNTVVLSSLVDPRIVECDILKNP